MHSVMKKSIVILITLYLAYIIVYYGMNIPYSIQHNFLSNLKSFSSISFFAIGVWLVFIAYPHTKDTLNILKQKNNDSTYNQAKQSYNAIPDITQSLTTSIMIFAFCIATPIIKEIISTLPIFIDISAIKYLRGALLFTTMLLTLIQLHSLYIVLLHARKTQANIEFQLAKYKTKNERLRNQQF